MAFTPSYADNLSMYGAGNTYAPSGYSSISQASPTAPNVRSALPTSAPTTTTASAARNTQNSATTQAQSERQSRTNTVNERSVANLNQTATTTGQQRETGTIITDTMDPTTRAAYNQLVATLQGGGTATQRQANANLAAQATNAMNLAGQYSMDVARDQAQASMGLYTQQLNESILPNINAAMEAAGMSGDSMNALLAQDAMVRVSRQAADAELQAILGYGQLQQGQQQIAAGVSAQMQADPVAQQLIAALGVGKGSYTAETRNLLTDMSQTTRTTGTTTTDSNRTETDIVDRILNSTSNTTQQGKSSGNEEVYDVTAEDALKTAEQERQLQAMLGKIEYLTGREKLIGLAGATSSSTALAHFGQSYPVQGEDLAGYLGI